MKYILLAYTNVDAWADATPEEMQATGPDVYSEIGRELVERGEAVYNAGLGEPPHTRTLRKRGDQVVVTDGPYAETKESSSATGSSTCDEPERAIEIAARTSPATGAAIEVRPLMDGGRTERRETPGRGPAARAGAAGPRRAGPPLRPLRRLRGRGAGGAAGRRAAVAARGLPGQPAGLADHGRVAPADRPARAARAPGAGARSGRRSTPERVRRAGAAPDADDTLTLLFLCCHPALSPPSQLALTLRAVGGLTTAEIAARVPRARADDGAADQPGQAAHPRRRRAVPPAAGGGAGRAASRRAARALPDLQRGLHGELRPRPAPRRAHRRGDPADPDACTGCCPTTARSRGCSR